VSTVDNDRPPVDDHPMATRWARSLASWGIPQPILDAAPRDPWGFPVARFAGRADRAVAHPGGASYERAVAALSDDPGSVLDVGAGAGAACLPLAPMATLLTAVDDKAEMLAAFEERATRLGVSHRSVQGSWPAVAGQVDVHDVVVTHHVVYNVPAISAFLRALTNHAKRRVVVELPPRHPLSWMNPLWERFHGISRPSSPTADDLVAVLEELGVTQLDVDRWSADAESSDGSDSEDPDARAALVAQRLCLPQEREPEVGEALREMDSGYHRELVTVSWQGGAGGSGG